MQKNVLVQNTDSAVIEMLSHAFYERATHKSNLLPDGLKVDYINAFNEIYKHIIAGLQDRLLVASTSLKVLVII